tara:strand:- start:407 stop:607 length:201 start_codon:yes stop_codon:yes gene_type:complete
LVEQLTFNQLATGSNPVGLTNKPLKPFGFGGLFFPASCLVFVADDGPEKRYSAKLKFYQNQGLTHR